MSDPFNEYMKKVDAMIDRVEAQFEDIAKVWQIKLVSAVIRATYGPGNQWHGTPYEATGRLRAGWRWGAEPPPARVGQFDGGPFDGDGNATISQVTLKILSSDLPPVTWAYNTVAYAWLVHEGKGGHKHIGRRAWVEIEAARGQRYLDEARREVMSRS